MCALCVTKMMKMTFELSHSSLFRRLYHHLVVAVFQPSILAAKPGSNLYCSLTDAFDEVMSNSEHKLYLLEDVLARCTSFWFQEQSNHCDFNMTILKSLILSESFAQTNGKMSEPPSGLLSAYNHIDFLIHCLTYIPPTTKDVKVLEQVARLSGLLENGLGIGKCGENAQ